jgi:hypothetical protein
MVKGLAILAIALGLAYGESTIAQPPKQVDYGNKAAQRSQPDKRGTPESPLMVAARSIQANAEAAEEEHKDAEQKNTDRWIIGLTFALGVCALLQAVGVFWQGYIYRQQTKLMLTGLMISHNNAQAALVGAKAAQESAEAALKQAGIQSIAMRQWVNIAPVGISRCVRPDKPGFCEVSLRFEIINKTDYLMMILRIETNIGSNAHDSTQSVVDCNQPLVPQKSEGDSSHPFYAKTLVDSGIWNEKGRIFAVTGTVTYLDCMEVRRTQTFEDLYLGIEDGELRRMKPSGISNAAEDQHPQKPNDDPTK